MVFLLALLLVAGAAMAPTASSVWMQNGVVAGVGLMAMLWILSQFFGREAHLVTTLLSGPLLLVATYAITRYGLTEVESVARQAIIGVVAMALYLFLVTNVIRHRWQFTCLLVLLLAVGAVWSAEAVWEFLRSGFGSVWASDNEAVCARTAQSRERVAFLHMIFPLAAGTLLFSRRSMTQKIISAFAALLFLAGMAVSGESRHWWAWILSVVVMGVFLMRKHRWRLRWALLSGVVLLIVAGATWLALRKLEPIAPSLPSVEVDGAAARPKPSVPLWRSTLAMAVREPWIGVGPGMFPWRYPEHRGQQSLPDCAGNQYLTVLAEYGAAGAALALWVIVAFTVAVILILRARARRYSASTPSNRYAFAVSGLAAFAAAVVDTGMDCSFDSLVNQLTLATIMGATLTCGIQNHNEGSSKSHSAGRLTLVRMTKVHRVLLTCCSLLGVGLFLWLLVHTCPGSILLHQAGRHVAQEEWSTAQGLYQKALRLDPKNFEAITGMGDVLAASKETDELHQALTWYERALVLNPYAHGLRIKMGQIHDRLGNREKAGECYRLAVQYDPRNAAYHVARAEHHRRWNEDDLAKEACRRAVALDSSAAPAATNAPPDVVAPPDE